MMMKKTFRSKRQAANFLWPAVLALAFATLPARIGTAADVLTDGAKRQRIETMYVEYKKSFPDVPDMDPRHAMQLVEENNVVFIDVRKPEEQSVSMLPGAITHNAYLENPDKYGDYIKIAYCTIAYRSGKFAQKLKKKGITVFNLRGGILAWVHADGKVYNQHGQTHRIHVYGRRWNLGPQEYEAVW